MSGLANDETVIWMCLRVFGRVVRDGRVGHRRLLGGCGCRDEVENRSLGDEGQRKRERSGGQIVQGYPNEQKLGKMKLRRPMKFIAGEDQNVYC